MTDAPQDDTSSHEDEALAADIESIVALIPCPFEWTTPENIESVHIGTWQEVIDVSLTQRDRDPTEERESQQAAPSSEDGDAEDSEEAPPEPEIWGEGTIRFEDDEHIEAQLVVESPLEGLVEMAGTSLEPITPTEAVLLANHSSVWRVTVPAGKRLGRRGAKRVSQLMATFIETGGCAVYMPALVRLHSARFIRKQTMDLFDLQGVTNLFVSAFREDDWMRTRGLTSFGLPELEMSTEGGVNAAYFTLMDVSASLLSRMSRYPDGATLQLGHNTFTIFDGPQGIDEDADVPFNGCFGVQTITS